MTLEAPLTSQTCVSPTITLARRARCTPHVLAQHVRLISIYLGHARGICRDTSSMPAIVDEPVAGSYVARWSAR